MGGRRRDLGALWKRYKQTGDAETRDTLIEAYLPLVRYVAERLKGKLPQCVDIQEMMSAGAVGLIDAVEKFDLDRGIKFSTYCTQRVRGAILDDLRASDWVPRLIRSKSHKLEKARTYLAFKLGREPKDEELAKHLGLTLAEYGELVKEVEVKTQMPIEACWSDDTDDHEVQRVEILEDRSERPTLETLAVKELRQVVMKGLSPKERRIVDMYYFQNKTMKEIGKVLSISESRVCQIHSQILSLLRERLGEARSA